MDRVISLLAALVGLIALAGAVLVSTHADLGRQQLADDIAALKAQMPAAASGAPVPSLDVPDPALAQMQSRLSSLEALVASQAAQIAAQPAASASAAVAENTVTALTPIDESLLPSQGASAAAITPDGASGDCIPLGTRFMAKGGDSFPICKTKLVVRVASVDDGSATLSGTGPVTVGGATALPVAGCQAMVLAADLSGFAELRVTCQ